VSIRKPRDSDILLIRNALSLKIGQSIGWASAVTIGLVGKVKGLVGKFPPSTLYGKMPSYTYGTPERVQHTASDNGGQIED